MEGATGSSVFETDQCSGCPGPFASLARIIYIKETWTETQDDGDADDIQESAEAAFATALQGT
jgi:hypothetical protein